VRLPGIPDEALDLENRAIGKTGEPTLFAAFEILQMHWQAGSRSRELGLHLLFLSWYLMIEPPCLTGFDETRLPSGHLPKLFAEIHDYFGPAQSEDAELLYVISVMAGLSPPWPPGESATWEHRSNEYLKSYRLLAPHGLMPAVFDGRGAFGDYFGGQLRAEKRVLP
jgi:hypothetical protein